MPTVARVAYLVNPDNAGTLDVLAELKLAAAPADVVLIGVEFGSATNFDGVVAAMLRERAEVLLVSNDPFHQLHVGRIIDFLCPTARVCPTYSGAPLPTCIASCRAPSPQTFTRLVV